VTQQRVRTF